VKDQNFEKHLKNESEQLSAMLKMLEDDLSKAQASLEAKQKRK